MDAAPDCPHGLPTRAVFNETDSGDGAASSYAADWWRCADAALDVYTEEGVRIWMVAKNRVLGDKSPEDCIRDGETARVLAYIDFLAEGNFA